MSVPTSKRRLVYCARMNVIYHESRERVYRRWIRWTAFLSLLLSAAATIWLTELLFPAQAAVVGKRTAIALGFVVAIGNAAALAFDWYGQLSCHARLKSKWLALSADAGLLDVTDQRRFDELVRRVSELNAEEPPPVESALRKAFEAADVALGASQR